MGKSGYANAASDPIASGSPFLADFEGFLLVDAVTVADIRVVFFVLDHAGVADL